MTWQEQLDTKCVAKGHPKPAVWCWVHRLWYMLYYVSDLDERWLYPYRSCSAASPYGEQRILFVLLFFDSNVTFHATHDWVRILSSIIHMPQRQPELVLVPRSHLSFSDSLSVMSQTDFTEEELQRKKETRQMPFCFVINTKTLQFSPTL